jgi:hypothetical protein
MSSCPFAAMRRQGPFERRMSLSVAQRRSKLLCILHFRRRCNGCVRGSPGAPSAWVHWLNLIFANAPKPGVAVA